MRDVLPCTLASLIGLALWTATAVIGDRAEPWDSTLYWSVSYPVALALAVAIGFLFPERPWRWAALLIGSQALVIAMSAPGLGLLPLGLVMLAVLALPAMALAQGAASVRTALA
jgi:hypothetical protein